MAASAAQSGFGVTAEYLATGPSTYATIGELVNVSPPSPTRETIDVTHHGSPDGYREYIGSLKDGGEATLFFNYTEDGYVILQTIFDAGSETIRLTFPGSATLIFTMIPTGIPLDDVEVDGKMAMSMPMKVTGKPLFTPAP